MPLGAPGGARIPPFGRLLGAGLDARQFTDLSLVAESAIPNQSTIPNQSAIRIPQSALVTPADRFFIRTAAPTALPRPIAGRFASAGWCARRSTSPPASLESVGSASGRYLIECSGNSDQSNYGLMSTADWEGVPLGAVLDRVRPSSASYRVLVSGVDDEASRPVTSVPGASWIFSRGDLERAMLADADERRAAAARSRRAGPADRARLVRLRLHQVGRSHRARAGRRAGDDADAGVRGEDTSGRRRGQVGSAAGARFHRRRSIDTAAMPVRVEKWAIDGRVAYRIAGIIWGGSKPTNALSIRFRSGQPWVPVDDCPLPDVDADVERVDAHVASRGAWPLPDRPARRRPVNPHAAARHLFLREGDRDRRGVSRARTARSEPLTTRPVEEISASSG